MTNPRPTSKRFRLRFSIRTLVIVVTLVCCYAACWGPTKEYGPADVDESISYLHFRLEVVPVAPLVISVNDLPTYYNGSLPITGDISALPGTRLVYTKPRRYYFWFFGYVAKLPYEREVETQSPASASLLPPPTMATPRFKVSPPGSSPESQ